MNAVRIFMGGLGLALGAGIVVGTWNLIVYYERVAWVLAILLAVLITAFAVERLIGRINGQWLERLMPADRPEYKVSNRFEMPPMAFPGWPMQQQRQLPPGGDIIDFPVIHQPQHGQIINGDEPIA